MIALETGLLQILDLQNNQVVSLTFMQVHQQLNYLAYWSTKICHCYKKL